MSLFQNALDGPSKLSKSFLGQNYKYQDHIRSPDELGMSADGTMTAIGKDIGGLISYVQLLVAGGGDASKTNGPLGDRFFLKTGGQCKDLNTGNKVDRYIYIDNVPDGSLPFISSGLGGQKFDSLRGLVPGMLSNITRIEPTKIFGAFMMGAEPLCMEVRRNVIDENGNSKEESHHLIRPDINNNEDRKRFDDLVKEKNYKPEGFTVMKSNSNRGKSKRPYAARRPYGSIRPYGPDRPYYPSEQNVYHSPYLSEGPYIEKPPLPTYVMPVAIVPDFKLEKEVAEKEKDIVYAPDITHKPEVATVPQIKEIVIKHIDDTSDSAPAVSKKDYSKMPDDTFLKIYYSSLGLLGLYIFLKLMERRK